MGLPQAFLDDVRARTTLSALVGRTVKLVKAGREHKGCCPVHSEKTPSFTVNDEKGFAHCFGCGYHADPIKWLIDQQGLPFLDAVRQLAAEAGLEVPAPDPASAERAKRADTVREALETAQAAYAAQLEQAGAVMEYLAGRGIGPAAIAAFGLGYARGGDGSLKGRGLGAKLARAAGLLAARDDGSLYEVFHDRVTIPIHDARGQIVGFAGRVWPGRRGDTPKFVNSPEGPLFDKGRLLFNLHRAAPAARPQRANRLIMVEGQLDVVSLALAGIEEAVAPMGTALTEAQLVRAWRVHHRPTLLFDGDEAGRKAAVRACRIALPLCAPGNELEVVTLPDGRDPDDLVREGGAGAIEGALKSAVPMHEFLFTAAMEGQL